MNIANVMDEIGTALDTIPGLRVYPFSATKVAAPAAVIGWPDEYTYDASFGRGQDRLVLPVYILVGNVDARSSRDRIAAFADGTGPSSVKTVVEAATYTACDSVRVQTCEFSTITVAGTEFLAATFQIDVTGTGS